MWLSDWTTSSPEQTMRQQVQWPAIFDPCQGKNFIPSFGIGSHLHQNPKTNSMLPERILLIFTNFPLVSVSQNNVNSIAVFQYNVTLFPSIQLSRHSIDFFVSQMTVTSRSINQLPRWPYKTTTFILTFYSSNNSWKVLDENVQIFNSLF